MERYEASTYGERIASIYDLLYPAGRDAEDAADFIAGLVASGAPGGATAGAPGGGRVLELGIGTGRVALPLAQRGVEIHGIDASESMLAQLRAKPGGDALPVVLGDFTALAPSEPYAIIFVAFNTFFQLPSQNDQVRCLASVAEHLAPGGAFILEAFVPDVCRYDRGQRTATSLLAGDWVVLESTVHDPVGQKFRTVNVLIAGDQTRLYPLEARYAWPAEIDLMARLAGLTLEQRWGGWQREPFTATSERHVSIYRRPG
ncbi:MAG TPA: class I SAM-dependent methyltransferase [Actinomycetota bacterium]|nr:class I SAM-dependent methyltransferase [Actinomycetota bacterium]